MKKLAALLKQSNRKIDRDDIMPFVFRGETLMKSNIMANQPMRMSDLKDTVLTVPYKIFSIESTLDYLIRSTPSVRGNEQSSVNIALICVLCEEVAPGKYDFEVEFDLYDEGFENYIKTAYMFLGHQMENTDAVTNDPDEHIATLVYGVTKLALNGILENILHAPKIKCGTVDTNKYIKYRGPKRKMKKYRPKKVIFISDKEYDKKILGTTVDWSHRWEVRGHWRKLRTPESLGKDRSGEYCVYGWTYVIPHEKGEGELIKKTRVKT